MSLLMRFADWFVDKWLQSCRHDGGDVLADLMEGDGPTQVQVLPPLWGTCAEELEREWRRPRPLWSGGRMTCPRCGAVMYPDAIREEARAGKLRWRCHAGHSALSGRAACPDTLSKGQ